MTPAHVMNIMLGFVRKSKLRLNCQTNVYKRLTIKITDTFNYTDVKERHFYYFYVLLCSLSLLQIKKTVSKLKK